jgi:hypothetical protein
MVTGTIHFYLGAIRIAQLIQTRGLSLRSEKKIELVYKVISALPHRFRELNVSKNDPAVTKARGRYLDGSDWSGELC